MGNSFPSVVDVGGRELKIKSENLRGDFYACEDEFGVEFSLKFKRVLRKKNGEIVDEDTAEMMNTEQAILKRIPAHPNILRMVDYGVKWDENEVQYYILSEKCQYSVSMLLADACRSGFLPERTILFILRDLLSALIHLHGQTPPIAHRNITTDTIHFCSDNRFKLSGFGSCSVRHREFVASRDILEAKDEIRRRTKPAYRSPEQVDLQAGYVVSQNVDIWAVGVLLFKLAFNRTPFEDSRGDIQNLRILAGFKNEIIPAFNPFSPSLINIMELCFNKVPHKRPSSSSLMRLCESLNAGGNLPHWPLANDTLLTHEDYENRVSTTLSEGGRTPPRRGSSKGRSKSFMDDSRCREVSDASFDASSRKNDLNVDIDSSRSKPRKGSNSNMHTPSSKSSKDSSRRKSTGSSKVGLLIPSSQWMGILGEEMKAKWYKVVGGEQETRLWVLKATSRVACGPKPKYVRKIVLALWDGGFAISSYFELLRFRPIEESPIVAAKALITLLRALQQGPPQCLMECCSYAEMINEIGEIWAYDEDTKESSLDSLQSSRDPTFLKLIVLFASSVSQKVRFNQQHPDIASLFAATNSNEKAKPSNDSFEIEATRAFAATEKLLEIQNLLISVQEQVFVVLACGSNESNIVSRSLLSPLVNESFANFMVIRRLLMKLNYFDKVTGNSLDLNVDQSKNLLQKHITTFEQQASKLQECFQRADEIDEVRLLGRTPVLPIGKLFDTSNASISKVPRKTDQDQNGQSAAVQNELPATYLWPTNKYDALRTLRHEESLLSKLITNQNQGDDNSDDDSDSDPARMKTEKRRHPDAVGAKNGQLAVLYSNESSSSSNSELSKENADNSNKKTIDGISADVHKMELTQNFVSKEESESTKNLSTLVIDTIDSANPPQLPPRKPAISGEAGSPPPLPPRSDGKQPAAVKVVTIKSGSVKDANKNTTHDIANQRRMNLNGNRATYNKNRNQSQKTSRSPVVYHGTTKALYDFKARSPEQLSFKAGDIIKKIRETINDKGWGLGELNGVIGWYPGDFVKDIPASEENNANEAPVRKQPTTGQIQKNKSSKLITDDKIPAEHQFAIHMAKAQPWRDRLTKGGKIAYHNLISYFNQSGLVIEFDSLQLKGVIGSGAFATVFLALYKGQEVAVKKLMGGGGGPMEKTLKDFMTEASLLSRLRHKNIVAPIGATIDPVTIVMEYCGRGNLMMLLNDTNVEIPWYRKRQICLDVAMGMRYLHSQEPIIIHRDLKSLNVLVDENWVSKVTDFGLSRFKATSESEKMTGQAGTYHWMAPEVINSQHYTEKADVFSFGIIMWEVYTRNIPYNGMQPVQVVALVVNRRERPKIPISCPAPLSQLMQQCWNHDPRQRPSFAGIVSRLEMLPE